MLLARVFEMLAAQLAQAQGNAATAVEMMKQGALDFITKPLDYEKLKAVLAAAQEDIHLRRQSRRLKRRLT